MTNTQRHRLENTALGRRTASHLREMAALTQFDVADKAGISQSKLSLYESGFLDLTDAELRQLTKALNVLVKKADFVPLPPLTSGKDDTLAERYAAWSKRKQIGARRSLRRQAHLTVMALAEKIGVPEKKLRQWEKDREKLSDADFAKWQEVLFAAIVKQKKADPWARLEVRIQIALEDALEAHEGKILDHPLIAEITESFRREISALEEQSVAKTPVTPDAEEGAD